VHTLAEQIRVDPATVPAPAPITSNEAMGRGDVPIELVFFQHDEAGTTEAFKAVDEIKPDIIAIESVSFEDSDPDYVRNLEMFYDRIASGDEKFCSVIDQLPAIQQAIANGIRGSSATIKLIDRPPIDAVKDYEIAVDKFKDTMLGDRNTGNGLEAEQLQGLHDYVSGAADMYAQREGAMAAQLEELQFQNPGKRIAAFIGQMHTPVSHILKRDGFDMKRTFPGKARGNLEYTRADQLIRAQRLLGHVTIDRGDLERVKADLQ
jgi:hypothetical protein